MRYSDYEQRQMDAEYSLKMDREEIIRQQLNCRDQSNLVDTAYECTVCNAVQGEACRRNFRKELEELS